MTETETSSDEMILAVERALGEKLKWTDPPRNKPDWQHSDDVSDGAGSQYRSGAHSDLSSSENVLVEQPWCFVLVQPGMAERWKVMCPNEAPRMWVLDPANPNALWYRLPMDRVQSAIRRIQPLTPASYMVGLYFRRAARLMSCYLVGDPSSPDTWQEIQCQPELQSPNSREHVFAHLLAVPGFLAFRILEFGAVENPRSGAVTIRVATYITSMTKWGTPGPEMTTAGRRIEAPGPSSAPAARDVGRFISSCVKGRMVYIAIVTPPSGQQQGLVQVWMYSWEDKVFAEHIGAMGWRNDPKVGKAVWETFQVLFDYDSEMLKIWAGWTEDELYTGEVDRNAKWKVSRFGRLKLDIIARKWVLDRTEGSAKVRDATLYFSQPCYASGSGRDVQMSSTWDGDYVSSRKSNYGEIGFEDSSRSWRLPYPPDEYLAAQGGENAAECVCIGSFRPRVGNTKVIRQVAAQTKFAPLLVQTWLGNTKDIRRVAALTQSLPPLVAAQTQSVPPLVAAQTQSVPPLVAIQTQSDPPLVAALTQPVASLVAALTQFVPPLVAVQTQSVPPSVHTQLMIDLVDEQIERRTKKGKMQERG